MGDSNHLSPLKKLFLMVRMTNLECQRTVCRFFLANRRVGKIGFVFHIRFPKTLAQRNNANRAVIASRVRKRLRFHFVRMTAVAGVKTVKSRG